MIGKSHQYQSKYTIKPLLSQNNVNFILRTQSASQSKIYQQKQKSSFPLHLTALQFISLHCTELYKCTPLYNTSLYYNALKSKLHGTQLVLNKLHQSSLVYTMYTQYLTTNYISINFNDIHLSEQLCSVHLPALHFNVLTCTALHLY